MDKRVSLGMMVRLVACILEDASSSHQNNLYIYIGLTIPRPCVAGASWHQDALIIMNGQLNLLLILDCSKIYTFAPVTNRFEWDDEDDRSRFF